MALITGASRGIGRGIALALARCGFDLVINYARNSTAATESLAGCLTESGNAGKAIRAEVCQADISTTAGRVGLIDFTQSSFGRIDLLVNNAGIAPEVRTDLLEATEASFDQLWNTNAKGPFFLTQLAARRMIEQTRNQSSGGSVAPKIVIISSVSAYTASVNRGEYCVSKAALSMIASLFATRLAEHGIGVYEIRPGLIATDMTGPVKSRYDRLIADGLTPIKRWGTPEDVAKAVTAIALDLLPFSTGEVINVDGGFHLRRL